MAGGRALLDDIIDAIEAESVAAGKLEVEGKILEDFLRPSPSTAPAAPPPQQRRTPPPLQSAAPRMAAPRNQPITPAEIAALDLDALREAAKTCRQCPLSAGRRNVVFGAGAPDADLMFIGEGPGREEDEQGVPFVGAAGALLTKMINAMRFQRSEVYIANIVKCRPPGNRNPEDGEADACLPFLRRQIELIAPKAIVLLGAVPLKHLMGKTGITRLHGNWMDYQGIKVIPTFHPAYLLRNPAAKKDAWSDLQKVMTLFGKTPSAPAPRR